MGGAHWRNLANAIEPSMCGGDAAFCQLTLTTSYFFVTAAPAVIALSSGVERLA